MPSPINMSSGVTIRNSTIEAPRSRILLPGMLVPRRLVLRALDRVSEEEKYFFSTRIFFILLSSINKEAVKAHTIDASCSDAKTTYKIPPWR